MSFTEHLAEDRRLCLLRVLAEAPGYSANESILHQMIEGFGHAVSRDVVRGDLAWLAEQELIGTREIEDITIARITNRGLDAARGRTQVPGVKKPSPGA